MAGEHREDPGRPLHLNADEQADIRRCIHDAEARTRGEIVCMVLRRSYNPRALLWATLGMVALILPWLLMWLTHLPASQLLLVQALVLLLGSTALVSRLGEDSDLHNAAWHCLPDPVRRHLIRREAQLQFRAHRLDETADRAGVLIYLTLAERRAELVADAGMADKVGQDVWDSIVDALTASMAQGDMAVGLTTAINAVADLQATHFPLREGDPNPNELPDLITPTG